MAASKTSIQQTAQFAMLAPIVAISLNFLTAGPVEHTPWMKMFVGVITGLMVLAGFVAAIVALVRMVKHGRQGALWQALTGLCLSTVLIGFVIFGLSLARKGGMPTIDDLPLRQQLIGNWVRDANGGKMRIRLRADNTFQFLLSGPGTADFSGKWSVQNRALYLNPETIVEGNREKIANGLRWGIDSVDSQHLSLAASDGKDQYTREQSP